MSSRAKSLPKVNIFSKSEGMESDSQHWKCWVAPCRQQDL